MPYSFPQTTYPVVADVSALIAIDAGITLPAGIDLGPYVQEAIDEWEQDTRYRPFLQTGSTPVTLPFDPPGPNLKGQQRGGGRILLLDRGFISISAVVAYISAQTPAGTTLVEGTDYRLKPIRYTIDNVPITQIEFFYAIWGLPSSVKVTGVPGYSTTIKADAWNAIRNIAAGKFAKSALEGIFASPTEIKTADETTRQDSFRELGSAWLTDGEAVKTKYTLLSA